MAGKPASSAEIEAALAGSELRIEHETERYRETETEGETFRITSLPEALEAIAQRLGVDLEEVRARIAARPDDEKTLPVPGRDRPPEAVRVGSPDAAHRDSS